MEQDDNKRDPHVAQRAILKMAEWARELKGTPPVVAFNAKQLVLEAVAKEGNIPEDHREAVAREVVLHWSNLRLAVIDYMAALARDEAASGGGPEYDEDTALRDILARWGKGAASNVLIPGSVATEAGDVWWQDDLAATYLQDEFGAVGAELAKEIRIKGAERLRAFLAPDRCLESTMALDRCLESALEDLQSLWGPPDWWAVLRRSAVSEAPWKPKPPLLPRFLARAVWEHTVKPRIERERALMAPALAVAVLERIRDVTARSAELADEPSGLVVLRGTKVVANLTPERRDELARRMGRVPGVVDDTLRDILARRVAALKTPTAHRVLNHLVRWGHEHQNECFQGNLRYTIDGGAEELARRIGASGQKQVTSIRDCLWGLDSLEIPIEGGKRTGGQRLIGLRDEPATGRRKGRLIITLNEPILPNYSFNLRDNKKLLAPMLDGPTMPMVGGPRNHGPQWAFRWCLSLLLTTRSPELAERGSVWLPEKDWLRLADEAELTRRLVDELRGVYISPGGHLFALLERKGTDRYTLTDAFKSARDFLIEQGKRRIGASARGRRGARERRRRNVKRGE